VRPHRGKLLKGVGVLVTLHAIAACGSSSGTLEVAIDAGNAPSDAESSTALHDGGDASTTSDATSKDGASNPVDAATQDQFALGDDAAPDGSHAADGGSDAPSDGPPCSTITNAAPSVTTTLSDASAPPASTGGTIVSGTYYITSVTSYGGAAGCAGLHVSGETIVTAQGTSGSTVGVITYNLPPLGAATTPTSASYTTSGQTVTFTSTCPSGGDAGVTQPLYTATATTLTLVEPAILTECGTAVEVLTKQ
jgi:hypothetical protein